MVAYYNEFDPFAAQWLRNLIAAKLIAPGDVDERSIVDVRADDLREYTQCHFFAGIGGWSRALRLAGWSDDEPVWTGSCPCQPFASAGKRGRQQDERHLWPSWSGLIGEQEPPVVLGEQVDDAIAAGWIDDAFHDLEAKGYACASAVLPACSVGAPHERQRLWFVADRFSTAADGRNTNGRRICGHEEMGALGIASDAFSGQQRQEAAGRHSRNGSLGEAAPNRDEARRTDGQVEPRIRAAEITLNRCSFVEAWQSWNGGFGGFGRLDDGVSPRVAKSVVGGFGNAIVPQVAAEFIRAYRECLP